MEGKQLLDTAEILELVQLVSKREDNPVKSSGPATNILFNRGWPLKEAATLVQDMEAMSEDYCEDCELLTEQYNEGHSEGSVDRQPEIDELEEEKHQAEGKVGELEDHEHELTDEVFSLTTDLEDAKEEIAELTRALYANDG